MLGVVATMALAAYQPMFPLYNFPAIASERRIVPPHKEAYFDSGMQKYTVEWGTGQTVDLQLRVPTRLGVFSDAALKTNVSMNVSGCSLLMKTTADASADYDPIFETELITLASVRGVRLRSAGQCNITIVSNPSDTPFCLQTGTTDALMGTTYGVGFPIHIMFISYWAHNFVYPYVLLALLPVAAAWHATKPWHPHLAYKIAVLVLMATSVSRAWQTSIAGIGTGFFLTLLPLVLAAAACYTASHPQLAGALVAVAILVPTRSWLDIIALSAAVALNK